MKKLKSFVFLAILGAFCAFLVFNKENVVSAKTSSIAIQLGVFKNEVNAQKVKDRLGGEVFNDNGMYRVYFSVLHDKKNIDFICKYLDEKGISYYKRNIDVSENAFLKSDVYEKIMIKKTNDLEKIKTNKELIKFYKEVIK